jgi:hypothetical protein
MRLEPTQWKLKGQRCRATTLWTIKMRTKRGRQRHGGNGTGTQIVTEIQIADTGGDIEAETAATTATVTTTDIGIAAGVDRGGVTAQRKDQRMATSGGGAAAQKGGEMGIATVTAAVIEVIQDGKLGAAAGVGAGTEGGG